MALRGADLPKIGDASKRLIGDAGIRVAIADVVERVEGIEAEAQGVSLDHGEVLERGKVGIQVSGAAYRAIPRGAEGVGRRNAECAGSVVYTWRSAGRRGWIGAEPVAEATMNDFQFTVLIGARGSVAVGVIAGSGDGLRKAGVGNDSGGEFPAADCFIDKAIRVGEELVATADRESVHAEGGYVVGHVVARGAPIRVGVVIVLERPAEPVDVERVVAEAVGHGLAVGVIAGELEAVAQALAKRRLHRIEVHLGPRLGN